MKEKITIGDFFWIAMFISAYILVGAFASTLAYAMIKHGKIGWAIFPGMVCLFATLMAMMLAMELTGNIIYTIHLKRQHRKQGETP